MEQQLAFVMYNIGNDASSCGTRARKRSFFSLTTEKGHEKERKGRIMLAVPQSERHCEKSRSSKSAIWPVITRSTMALLANCCCLALNKAGKKSSFFFDFRSIRAHDTWRVCETSFY